MPEINTDRLLKDLYAVREIGKYKTGVHRPTFSPQDIEARNWLVGRLADAGLESSIDGIGNVYGLDPKPGRNEICPCGSGLKFKRCCLNKPRAAAA